MAKKLNILMEGDSWCKLPDLPFSLPAGVLGSSDYDLGRALEAKGHKVMNIARWKDTMRDIRKKRAYMPVLNAKKVDAFVLAAGGNDLLGDQMLRKTLRLFDKDRKAKDYLNHRWYNLYHGILSDYERVIADVRSSAKNKKVPIFCHGYDYVRPAVNDIWLAQPMKFQGIKKRPLQEQIVKHMLSTVNLGLRRLARDNDGLYYVNFRNTVKDNWQDVLHPTKVGYDACGRKLERAIIKAVNS